MTAARSRQTKLPSAILAGGRYGPAPCKALAWAQPRHDLPMGIPARAEGLPAGMDGPVASHNLFIYKVLREITFFLVRLKRRVRIPVCSWPDKKQC